MSTIFNKTKDRKDSGKTRNGESQAVRRNSLPDEDTAPEKPKKILITGANSYIGESVRDYLTAASDMYSVGIKDTIGWTPAPEDLKGYDTVFNVAGIAHGKETDVNRHLYYEVNRDLVINIARAAKEARVPQMIMLSSMSVYGLTEGYITKDTEPNPVNAYGLSKLEADIAVSQLRSNDFRIAILRPPMVYGPGCRGNYQTLRSFALKSPVFPDYSNMRSMVYIDNLSEFVKRVIDREEDGLFFPQNEKYVCTKDMVSLIAQIHGHRIKETPLFNPALKLTGLRFDIIRKVFGNLTYEKVDCVSKTDFTDSIYRSEGLGR